MALSKTSITTLLDLVENKISQMEVMDREDARELQFLEQIRRQLVALVPARSVQTVSNNNRPAAALSAV